MHALRALTLASLLAVAGCGTSSVVGRAPGGAPIVQVPLRLSNVHVVRAPRPVMIDTGTLGDMPDLARAADDAGIDLRALGLVIVTHAHADHAGLAADLRLRSGATVMLGEGDLERARAGRNDPLRATSVTAWLIEPLIPKVFPELVPDVTVSPRAADGVDLRPWGLDGRAIALPGHTPGSIAVVLSSREAFVGDLLAGGYLGGALRPTHPGEHYYHADREQNRRNIAALLAMGVERFYLGHGGPVSRADVATAMGFDDPKTPR